MYFVSYNRSSLLTPTGALYVTVSNYTSCIYSIQLFQIFTQPIEILSIYASMYLYVSLYNDVDAADDTDINDADAAEKR